MTINTSLYSTKALVILDGDGKRVLAKYYHGLHELKDQKQFEKQLFEKSKKTQNEILLMEDSVVVYKTNLDLYFYLAGSLDENELILSSLMNSFYETVSNILKSQVDKRAFLENLDAIVLALDEFFDTGITLDTESAAIVQRVQVKRNMELNDVSSMSFNEETIQQMGKSAKSLLKNFFN